jgi:electron transport complex protein RnfE
MTYKGAKEIIKGGLLTQNPTFRLVLGMCPTLAVTTALANGIGMGLATTFVLIFSNLLISLLKNIIPDKIRIPAFILLIATFVTIVDMSMQKFMPDLYESLGIFIPLIVVNCIIFARAEAFASANPVADSVLDGMSMGLGFTISLSVISTVRELLSNGTILGVTVFGDWFPRLTIFSQPAGGFLTLGLLMAALNAIYKAVENKNKKHFRSENNENISSGFNAKEVA